MYWGVWNIGSIKRGRIGRGSNVLGSNALGRCVRGSIVLVSQTVSIINVINFYSAATTLSVGVIGYRTNVATQWAKPSHIRQGMWPMKYILMYESTGILCQ
jgi:hypothetical protein